MSAAETTLWARCFVDELARHGVREVVLAPGSRSTPLVMAIARDDRFRVRVHLDERSAGFFALGVGRAGSGPAAVVTTSGTAVANLMPAVVEASMAAVPLLVLSADRPPRLRGADANQTIDQVHLFGRYTREFFDVGLAVATAPALRQLRSLAGRAVAAARGPSAGPVHVNFPFDKPLEPEDPTPLLDDLDPVAAHGRSDGLPYVSIDRGRPGATDAVIAELTDLLAGGEGVIVAGPSSEPRRTGPAARALSAATGFPLLADPLSGARFGPSEGAHRVSAYDLFLSDAEIARAFRPSVVLRVRAAPTSAAVLAWLERHADVPQIVLDAETRWKDHGATAHRYVVADAADTMRALATSVPASGSAAWRALWSDAEAAVDGVLGRPGRPRGEADIAAAVCGALPPDACLVVSSSMPIRDVDAMVRCREAPLEVLANRGASGIDGVVSTAFGVASQRGEPVVCLIGDIALFHDQNGLLWSREPDAHVVFVLVDNDGGGIFHALPIAHHEPHFTELFATPHGLDFSHAAALHGLPCADASPADVGSAVRHALERGGSGIVRVRTNRANARAERDDLRADVREALAATLSAARS